MTGGTARKLVRLVEPISSVEEPHPTIAFIVMIDIPTSLMMNSLRTVDKSIVPVLEREFELKMKGGYVRAVHEGVFEHRQCLAIGYSRPIHDEVFGPQQRLDVLIGNETATG
jgi:hypothetical protein